MPSSVSFPSMGLWVCHVGNEWLLATHKVRTDLLRLVISSMVTTSIVGKCTV